MSGYVEIKEISHGPMARIQFRGMCRILALDPRLNRRPDAFDVIKSSESGKNSEMWCRWAVAHASDAWSILQEVFGG